MTVLAVVTLLVSAATFSRAAWVDFMTWKIPNRTILVLVACYVIFAGVVLASGETVRFGVDVVWSLAAAFLLMAIGFVLWQLKLLGAGDAKLMFPIGLFLGWTALLPFAIWLAILAVVALLSLKLPLPAGLGATIPGMRLNEIRRTGKVPYAVILVGALFVSAWDRYATAALG
ncbi:MULTISPECIES: prepilin peptidase [Aminobacter]|uniref:Peptidase A24A prepilin type IV n=3 Tax=Aminobacter TaxID=31988 RepID=A0AAC9FCV3_AMIAI|nr:MULTISPECIES: prepilin peptidase [Aminobacter]AMS39332.1 Peptidase A24A prepilin type IV [Aminobacter aminovorans]MBA8910211.1 prepilin peptidase CpaA [Aminobacter ciceronei]MBA9023965.1 prepilin peptidase CpaA [Aminobacter ciceronei]MBB3709944.1 prepilin peptidase CpaA [Aminobacter aminovorans]MBB6470401.1 prepilin peptidase CpaA [Aminobacter lissarensis]